MAYEPAYIKFDNTLLPAQISDLNHLCETTMLRNQDYINDYGDKRIQ